MLAIATLLIVVLLSLLVTRVATVALVLTGLSPDVAQFQARSAFSSTGYVSNESEQIVTHPARRQIVFTLMLLGNAGLVTTVATFTVSLNNTAGTGEALRNIGLLVVGLVLLLGLARNRAVSALLSRVIERVLRRYTDLDVQDYHGLLHLAMDYAVDRVRVGDDHWLAGRTLASSRLTDEGILVLGVERQDGYYVGAPTGGTTVEAGDTVLVYGASRCLVELHGRQAGVEGTEAHLDNVRTNEARVASERSADTRRRRRRRR